jgi:hypothetical protein
MKCNVLKAAAFLGLLIGIFSCTKEGAEGVKATLLIGIVEVNYTPGVGMDMAGNYRGDDYTSRGVHDSLYAKAIVASNEKGEKAAMLTVDICYIPKESVEMMRAHIASQTNILPGNLMIMATHTHSGPVAELSAPKVQEYLSKAAEAVVQADKDLKPTMKGKRVLVAGSDMYPLSIVVDSSIRRDYTDIGALAAKENNRATVMVWNYHDDDRNIDEETEVDV